MKLWQKIVLSLVGLLAVVVGVVCVYGIKIAGDAHTTIDNMYESVEREREPEKVVADLEASSPFSVLLLGIDSGGLGRTEQGRSDTTIVVTVNPQEKRTTLLSLDRDMYVEMVGKESYDKLNHAYAYGGVSMAIATVEDLLDIPINHYVTINLQGLSDLIDAVGGITVNNPHNFELDGVTLYQGEQTVNGEEGLAYARYRKYNPTTGWGDPNGDIGRQERQREVIQQVMNKVISFDGVTKYQDILTAVENNMKTDLSWNDLLAIKDGYLSSLTDVSSYQLSGYGETRSYGYYQFLNADNLLQVQNYMRNELGLSQLTELESSSEYTNGYNYGKMFTDKVDENSFTFTEEDSTTTSSEGAVANN